MDELASPGNHAVVWKVQSGMMSTQKSAAKLTDEEVYKI